MPRQQPPKGFLNLRDAIQFLNNQGTSIGDGMIYKYVKQGRLKRYGPESRKQKYYSIKELEELFREDRSFNRGEYIQDDIGVIFTSATIEDLDKITQLSGKLFKTATLRPIPTETRQAWFEKEPRGHYVVKKSDGELVAYLHILTLTDERIEAYMRNEIRGRDITGDDVQPLEAGKPVSCIVASIGSDPDVKDKALRHRHTGVLLHGVSKKFEEMGEQGLIVPRLYAYSESKSGILMSVRMRMNQYAAPIGHRFTFWLDILQAPTKIMRGYQRALGGWFVKHPEHAVALAEWKKQYHPGDLPG